MSKREGVKTLHTGTYVMKNEGNESYEVNITSTSNMSTHIELIHHAYGDSREYAITIPNEHIININDGIINIRGDYMIGDESLDAILTLRLEPLSTDEKEKFIGYKVLSKSGGLISYSIGPCQMSDFYTGNMTYKRWDNHRSYRGPWSVFKKLEDAIKWRKNLRYSSDTAIIAIVEYEKSAQQKQWVDKYSIDSFDKGTVLAKSFKIIDYHKN